MKRLGEAQKMGTRKMTASLFICMVLVSSAFPALGCSSCSDPDPCHGHNRKTLPPSHCQPGGGGGWYPSNPPYGGGGSGGGGSNCDGSGGGCMPPPSSTAPTCPVNALKLGACVDVLGGLVHVGLGDPAENACCPLLQGLVELEAAACLCTTLRLKVLNLNIYLPLALQLLITCGKTPPPGFICPP
ncbi:36.4 kDa proline-rich protein-like [Nymphaea colorata]|uniref:Bifunctional inhibitor/plant lipid transfer protein/seed storage helical domain-containing protein n=1 Tax=Nymphaea colorata TaxID=210225 RepID=A0A5K0YNH0_9MAGN|nr:36.4 kDa proline-rich protein-like [Nymphaea colorata]VVV79010.1 unnamed protein product [Nymphaea colorata]